LESGGKLDKSEFLNSGEERASSEYERWKERNSLSKGSNTQRMEKSFDIAKGS